MAQFHWGFCSGQFLPFNLNFRVLISNPNQNFSFHRSGQCIVQFFFQWTIIFSNTEKNLLCFNLIWESYIGQFFVFCRFQVGLTKTRPSFKLIMWCKIRFFMTIFTVNCFLVCQFPKSHQHLAGKIRNNVMQNNFYDIFYRRFFFILPIS